MQLEHNANFEFVWIIFPFHFNFAYFLTLIKILILINARHFKFPHFYFVLNFRTSRPFGCSNCRNFYSRPMNPIRCMQIARCLFRPSLRRPCLNLNREFCLTSASLLQFSLPDNILHNRRRKGKFAKPEGFKAGMQESKRDTLELYSDASFKYVSFLSVSSAKRLTKQNGLKSHQISKKSPPSCLKIFETSFCSPSLFANFSVCNYKFLFF